MAKVAASASANDKKGYVVALKKVTDSDFDAYPSMVPPTLTKYGGKMINKTVLKDKIYAENGEDFDYAVLLEFLTEQKAVDWYNSEEYEAAKD